MCLNLIEERSDPEPCISYPVYIRELYMNVVQYIFYDIILLLYSNINTSSKSY